MDWSLDTGSIPVGSTKKQKGTHLASLFVFLPITATEIAPGGFDAGRVCENIPRIKEDYIKFWAVICIFHIFFPPFMRLPLPYKGQKPQNISKVFRQV